MLKLLKSSRIAGIPSAKLVHHKSHRCSKLLPAKCNLSSNFHTASSLSAKIFIDKENQHARNILIKSLNYNICDELKLSDEQDTDQRISEILSQPPRTPDEGFGALVTVVNYCKSSNTCISGEQFDSFINACTDFCWKFSDDQLRDSLRILRQLPQTPSVNTRNFLDMWKALDDACVHRLDKWTTDQILLICDCWYALSLGKCSAFVRAGVKKVGRKLRQLTPPQLVQTLFLCNIIRKPLLDMYEFEVRFAGLVNTLSLDELGVMCTGFFKTQTKIHNPVLLENLYRRLIDNLETVGDITFVNFLKALRYSSKIPQADIMTELLEKSCPQINRISLLACLHLALTGCDIQICHDKNVKLILERFSRDIDKARLKDMERICHVMGLFNIETDSGIENELSIKIISKLHTCIDEIIQYPKCLQTCLHYLTLCGYHDEELISSALDQPFLKHVLSKNQKLGREVFCLDSFARINLKDTYTGNLLLDKQRRTMGKFLTHYIPVRNQQFKINVTDRILLEVKETCEDIYGVSNLKHVLPHYERPDIVISYDKKAKRSLSLSESCPEDYSGRILMPTDIAGDAGRDISSAVVVVGGWNNFVRKYNRPTGLLQMKMKQLDILGHHNALIPWYEWREQESTIDKQNYIRRKLSSAF